jgi:hypothetical protein
MFYDVYVCRIGPRIRRDYVGTGFCVTRRGLLVSMVRFSLFSVFSCETLAAAPRTEPLIFWVAGTFYVLSQFCARLASYNKDSLGHLELWCSGHCHFRKNAAQLDYGSE